MHQVTVVTTTLPSSMSNDDLFEFKSIFIENKLSACVQSKKISSTYIWGGELLTEEEWQLSFKTTTNRADNLISAIMRAHPYEVPQIIHRTEASTKEYISWVKEQVS